MQQFLTSTLSLSVLSIFVAIAFCLDQKDGIFHFTPGFYLVFISDLESQVMIKMFESFENAEKQREYRKMKNEVSFRILSSFQGIFRFSTSLCLRMTFYRWMRN